MKGNVNAELVLHSAAIEYDNYDKATRHRWRALLKMVPIIKPITFPTMELSFLCLHVSIL